MHKDTFRAGVNSKMNWNYSIPEFELKDFPQA